MCMIINNIYMRILENVFCILNTVKKSIWKTQAGPGWQEKNPTQPTHPLHTEDVESTFGVYTVDLPFNDMIDVYL